MIFHAELTTLLQAGYLIVSAQVTGNGWLRRRFALPVRLFERTGGWHRSRGTRPDEIPLDGLVAMSEITANEVTEGGHGVYEAVRRSWIIGPGAPDDALLEAAPRARHSQEEVRRMTFFGTGR